MRTASRWCSISRTTGVSTGVMSSASSASTEAARGCAPTGLQCLPRKQPAVDAVRAGRVIQHEMPHPVAVAARGGTFEGGLIPQVVPDYLDRAGLFQDIGGARGLDGAARMDGDGGGAGLDTPRQCVHELLFVRAAEEGAEILGKPGMRRRRRK